MNKYKKHGLGSQAGFTQIQNIFIRDINLTPIEFKILCFIISYDWRDREEQKKKGYVWPSLKTIRERTNLSMDSIIISLKVLDSAGIIEMYKGIRRNKKGELIKGKLTQNFYRFISISNIDVEKINKELPEIRIKHRMKKNKYKKPKVSKYDRSLNLKQSKIELPIIFDLSSLQPLDGPCIQRLDGPCIQPLENKKTNAEEYDNRKAVV